MLLLLSLNPDVKILCFWTWRNLLIEDRKNLYECFVFFRKYSEAEKLIVKILTTSQS